MTELKMKKFFFDRASVIAAVDAGTRQSLSKMGSFLMTRAKGLIKKRKKPSAAGEAPHSHVGTLKRLLFFAFDPSKKSVVVGPELFQKRQSTPVPRVLELGGTSTNWKGKQVKVAARPFMNPALKMEIEKGTVADVFTNCVK